MVPDTRQTRSDNCCLSGGQVVWIREVYYVFVFSNSLFCVFPHSLRTFSLGETLPHLVQNCASVHFRYKTHSCFLKYSVLLWELEDCSQIEKSTWNSVFEGFYLSNVAYFRENGIFSETKICRTWFYPLGLNYISKLIVNHGKFAFQTIPEYRFAKTMCK